MFCLLHKLIVYLHQSNFLIMADNNENEGKWTRLHLDHDLNVDIELERLQESKTPLKKDFIITLIRAGIEARRVEREANEILDQTLNTQQNERKEKTT